MLQMYQSNQHTFLSSYRIALETYYDNTKQNLNTAKINVNGSFPVLWSLVRVTCETRQVLLAGGQVVFLGVLPFLPNLSIDSAQMSEIILTGRKTPIKSSYVAIVGVLIMINYSCLRLYRFLVITFEFGTSFFRIQGYSSISQGQMWL